MVWFNGSYFCISECLINVVEFLKMNGALKELIALLVFFRMSPLDLGHHFLPSVINYGDSAA
jgi:hypothetical protein